VLFETFRVEGRAGKRFFGPEKRQLAGFGQQKTLPLPKRGSPGHALIEFVLRFRVGKRIARKTLFIEKDGPGVLFLPQRGPACRGDPRWSSGFADGQSRIRCTADASVMKATMRIGVPQVGQLTGNASEMRASSIAHRERAGERSGVLVGSSPEVSTGCAAAASGARAVSAAHRGALGASLRA
jgi:hypothetical protein